MARWLLEVDDLLVQALPAGAELWRGIETPLHRAYLDAPDAPGQGWQRLLALGSIAGASAGVPARYHYVVETDVAPESLERGVAARAAQRPCEGADRSAELDRAARLVAVPERHPSLLAGRR